MRALFVLLVVGCGGVRATIPAVDAGPELGDVPAVDAYTAPEQDAAVPDAPALGDAGTDAAEPVDAAVATDSAPGEYVFSDDFCPTIRAAFDATHCAESGFVCPLGSPGYVQQYRVDACAAAVPWYFDNPSIVGGTPCQAVHYLLVSAGTECHP